MTSSVTHFSPSSRARTMQRRVQLSAAIKRPAIAAITRKAIHERSSQKNRQRSVLREPCPALASDRRPIHGSRLRQSLSVQAGELTLPILLKTRPPSDLAACGDGDRARCYQDQICDAEAV